VTEYEFTTEAGAASYFSSIDYVSNGWWPVVDELSNSSGDAAQATSNVQDEVNYNIQWLSEDYIVNMSVWGGESLTAPQALSAVYAGYGSGASSNGAGGGTQVAPTAGNPVYSSLSQLPWGSE
jgi:hypothetical protein